MHLCVDFEINWDFPDETKVYSMKNLTYPEITRYLNKHFVPLHFHFSKAGKNYHPIISAFVISISNEWFLITAAHCLDDVEKNIKDPFCKLEKSSLIDYGSLEAIHGHPIPFDYESTRRVHIHVDKFDYGIIHLSNFYQRQLEANNIQPLNEDTWEKQPEDPDFYLLLGIPTELEEEIGEYKMVTPIIQKIDRCIKRPKCFKKTRAPMFYGKTTLIQGLTDIDGMSGGPIFSFKSNESGKLKYWLCAVQSRWIKKEALIAACLMSPFVKMVREEISKPKQSN